MFAIDGRTAQFQDFASDAREGSKIELLLTVVTQVMGCRWSGLHAISSDNFAAGAVFDNEMVTEQVEMILVESGSVGRLQTFAQFDVKDLEA